jgi:hypothetical protein
MPTPGNVELVRAAILCLHNQVRAQSNLPLLKDNLKLRKAASGHSSDMVDESYFDHTSPAGETFVDRVLGAGYAKKTDSWTLGENLAWGTGDLSTATGVMTAWMNSPGHKANILKRSYKEIGIGIRLGVPSDATVGATFTTEVAAAVRFRCCSSCWPPALSRGALFAQQPVDQLEHLGDLERLGDVGVYAHFQHSPPHG